MSAETGGENTGGEKTEGDAEATEDQLDLDDLAERAETALEELRTAIGDPNADVSELPDLIDEESSSETAEYVRDLLEIVDEVEDVLETIDLSELPDAVDFAELPELLEADELPEAISEGDLDEAVDLKKLATVVDLSELWGATDVRELWREQQELEDEVDDVTEDDDEDSLTSKLGLTDEGGTFDDVEAGEMGFDGLDDFDPEVIETAIQNKLLEGADEFREALLDARERVKESQDELSERMPETDRDTNSRNPTAVSTIPTRDRADIGFPPQFSTVPQETRYSSAPNRERLYGDRLDREADEGTNGDPNDE